MKKLVYFIPAIIWMIIIFMMSNQDGNSSSGVSLIITNFINQFLHLKNIVFLHFLVRKCAHISEYALLALFLYYGFIHISKNALTYAFLLSVLYAMSDEIHQLFISERAGMISDVLIDSIGAGIMIILIYIIRSFVIKEKKFNIKD